MIEQIENWIIRTNAKYQPLRHSCSKLFPYLNGFYSQAFLSSAYFVVVDTVPKPDFPELRKAGLGGFIDMNVDGITYNDTYYVKKEVANRLDLHFHELVHVLQWRVLSMKGFIQRYLSEIQTVGYDKAPLEVMAYSLQECFLTNSTKLSVEEYVYKNFT